MVCVPEGRAGSRIRDSEGDCRKEGALREAGNMRNMVCYSMKFRHAM